MHGAARLVGLTMGAGLICIPLAAAPPDPAAVQKSVDARITHYKEIAKAAKAIKDELDQSQPNLAAISANAHLIEALAPQIPSWFPSGTGEQPGVKTEALAIIWQQLPLFKQRAAGLAGAAHGLALAAGTGDVAATQAAANEVGGACKACHDTFRQKK
ncbi:c-type cytochrome [Sphingomonas agri]|uniref:c-type cytochrome n=1 Tax=Sphingomonas agri TaxID=1813878 RepID=UPI00311E6892